LKEKIKLIYILGAGHSGSTLLDHLLSSHDQIESGGEIYKYLPYVSDTLGVRPFDNRYCGCGAHITDCEYWKSIKSIIAEEHDTYEIDLNVKDAESFAVNNKSVIHAMLQTSGKSVFCDSSKGIVRLKHLVDSQQFDIWIVHLIRDGRAVGYSHQKKGHGFLKTVYRWQKILKRHQKGLQSFGDEERIIRLRYEDLVENPAKHLAKILSRVGLNYSPELLNFRASEHHILSGNRMRWSDEQEIRKDVSYIKKINLLNWGMADILSGVSLKKQGYSLFKK